jgi:hypothetical protein
MKKSFYLLIVVVFVFILGSGFPRVIKAQNEPPNASEELEIRAEVSPVIGYQGRLLEDGTPVTGVRSMTFKLFNAVAAGTLVWSETKNVAVSSGMFNTALGDTTPFTEAVRANMTQNLWLEVTVGSTVLPRQRLMGAPFAFTLAPGAVIEAQTPQYALNVHNDTTDGSGLYVRGKYGIATYGTTGYGISAYSESAPAVIAENNGTGLGGAALKAESNNGAGIAIWALAGSTDSALVSINEGTGPLIKAFGGDGGDEEFIVTNDGTVKQDPAASGLVKAAAHVYCNNTSAYATRYFNNTGGGLAVYNGDPGEVGSCYVDFGFDLTNRFWNVSSTYPYPDISTCGLSLTNPNQLICHNWCDGESIGGSLMIIVY